MGCEPTVNRERSQIGFIDAMLLPLFRSLAQKFPPLAHLRETLIATRHEWAAEIPDAPPLPNDQDALSISAGVVTCSTDNDSKVLAGMLSAAQEEAKTLFLENRDLYEEVEMLLRIVDLRE
jgi:hypothetical protein